MDPADIEALATAIRYALKRIDDTVIDLNRIREELLTAQQASIVIRAALPPVGAEETKVAWRLPSGPLA